MTSQTTDMGTDQQSVGCSQEGKTRSVADLQAHKKSKGCTIKPAVKANAKADDVDNPKPQFDPVDCTKSTFQALASLPDELWLSILQCSCTFPPDIFSNVMLNMIKHPNITASQLFRADIFYDSDQDRSLLCMSSSSSDHERNGDGGGGLIQHIKPEYRPRPAQWPGFQLTRTIVRQLVPRNARLDRPLMQTCHFFEQICGDDERNLVLYIPHTEKAEDMPFYHPAVSQLAFLHSWQHQQASPVDPGKQPGTVTLLYRPFPDTAISNKMERTALKLLGTIHKHGQGQLSGYEKRVHLDQIIPQKRYQDTYSRLKAKYGRQLSEQWVEVTDPGKHVFEDIGIAAYLIELWQDMYHTQSASKDTTPGFVDIGCGNGVLVHILLSEGYRGCGFDARRRKTWSIFPPEVQKHLHQKVLVPSILSREQNEAWHDGVFESGTFIISNHADELTSWTPLLAYLNNSSFIAIPCCSHDLAGARFRAPASTKAAEEASDRLSPRTERVTVNSNGNSAGKSQAAETGSFQRPDSQQKMPSAYATLCAYVFSLATVLGFEPEKDVLRIPSTRNSCILGRHRKQDVGEEEKEQNVKSLIEQELRSSISVVGPQWVKSAERLMKRPSSGH